MNQADQREAGWSLATMKKLASWLWYMAMAKQMRLVHLICVSNDYILVARKKPLSFEI